MRASIIAQRNWYVRTEMMFGAEGKLHPSLETNERLLLLPYQYIC